ncbi:hypothetical protein [Massilia sp. 9096]|uniref:hypothetical protein n=1 Tax=Massilia sp. 9096 TaxID=1500894 RepID=UPI00056B5337|nr:hypothetical protein [Massilia sp. 9096]
MIQLIIAATVIVGIAGLVVATWSIHRAHSCIVARNDALFERVDEIVFQGYKTQHRIVQTSAQSFRS